jgi:predicted DNA-binding protein with PD1-like motif
VHAHIVVGRSDGGALGGHLLGGSVDPTLEVTLLEAPATLQRKTDPATGLALIELDWTR